MLFRSLAENVTQAEVSRFTILPGETFEAVATSGNITCTGRVTVDPNSPSGEVFAVTSLHGFYNGLFPAQICALLRCEDVHCTKYLLTTTTLFTSFELHGTMENDALFTSYPMVAHTNAAIADPHFFQTNPILFPTSIRSTSDTPFTLLNAAIFGLEWHQRFPPT